ncbi:Kinase superfamily protein isoform 2 [Hibiscus syriacus]|uniref:Kinase superfamily protein isoform 2 n=1 Tax=Hibiscus syriacus TaxID=106335 RepID=A0A6A3BVW6_HIBSY|nr:Kinase superfamily protein isoform 2 [Hibiscus syriacus]
MGLVPGDIQVGPLNVEKSKGKMKKDGEDCANKSNDTSRGQPVVPVMTSSTTTNAESTPSTPYLREELQVASQLRTFSFNELKKLIISDYNAKLSDFGLAKDGLVGDKTHVSTRVMGTYGYAAPEYFMTDQWTKTDQMKSITWWNGLVPISQRDEDFIGFLIPVLKDSGQRAFQLAAHCLSRDPKARPLMSEVVEALKPLPNLKDMACSSSQFQAIQIERTASTSKARTGNRVPAALSTRGVQSARSPLTPNGQQTSPYHNNHHYLSPKPNASQP